MSLHALLDGVNLAIAFQAGPVAGGSVGVALTLHKFADGLTLTTLFRQAGYTERKSLLGLAGLALVTPLGALAGWQWLARIADAQPLLLGFAGGCFLYIASADILPRLHRENDRWCLALFSLGLISGACLKFLPH